MRELIGFSLQMSQRLTNFRLFGVGDAEHLPADYIKILRRPILYHPLFQGAFRRRPFEDSITRAGMDANGPDDAQNLQHHEPEGHAWHNKPLEFALLGRDLSDDHRHLLHVHDALVAGSCTMREQAARCSSVQNDGVYRKRFNDGIARAR